MFHYNKVWRKQLLMVVYSLDQISFVLSHNCWVECNLRVMSSMNVKMSMKISLFTYLYNKYLWKENEQNIFFYISFIHQKPYLAADVIQLGTMNHGRVIDDRFIIQALCVVKHKPDLYSWLNIRKTSWCRSWLFQSKILFHWQLNKLLGQGASLT